MEKYNGNKDPFLYGIFARKDENEALKILDNLVKKGYKLTYDEKRSEDSISRSSAVILFLSKNNLDDKKLLEEVNYASRINKDIVSIWLEDVELTPGLSMMLGQTQGIMKNKMSQEDFNEKLFNSAVLNNLQVSEQQKGAAKKQSLVTMASIAAIALFAILFILIRSESLFNSNMLLKQLGIGGNLSAYTKIYVYGEEVKDEYEIAQFIIAGEHEDDAIYLDQEVIDTGTIKDVSDFAKMSNLEELCLAGNEIESITPLFSLSKLRLLDISHNYSVDISGIDQLENLEVLNLAYTELEDYSILKSLTSLKKVYISVNERVQFDEMKDFTFEVVMIDRQVSTFEELKEALESDDRAISIITSMDIPEGEEIVIKKGQMIGGHSLGGEYGDIVINNYGTMIIEGAWEMGLTQRNNYGTIIVKDGGLYTGGMCDSYNFNTFIIEKGGKQIVERGHQFITTGNLYQNDGCLAFGGGGAFRYEEGRFVNNGTILWNIGQYGPSFFISGPDAVNNGSIYYNRISEEEEIESIYDYYKVDNPHGEIIDISSVNGHN